MPSREIRNRGSEPRRRKKHRMNQEIVEVDTSTDERKETDYDGKQKILKKDFKSSG